MSTARSKKRRKNDNTESISSINECLSNSMRSNKRQRGNLSNKKRSFSEMIDNKSEDESNYKQSHTSSSNEEHKQNVSHDNTNNMKSDTEEPSYIKRQKDGDETEEEEDEGKADVLDTSYENPNVKILRISKVCT